MSDQTNGSERRNRASPRHEGYWAFTAGYFLHLLISLRRRGVLIYPRTRPHLTGWERDSSWLFPFCLTYLVCPTSHRRMLCSAILHSIPRRVTEKLSVRPDLSNRQDILFMKPVIWRLNRHTFMYARRTWCACTLRLSRLLPAEDGLHSVDRLSSSATCNLIHEK